MSAIKILDKSSANWLPIENPKLHFRKLSYLRLGANSANKQMEYKKEPSSHKVVDRGNFIIVQWMTDHDSDSHQKYQVQALPDDLFSH